MSNQSEEPTTKAEDEKSTRAKNNQSEEPTQEGNRNDWDNKTESEKSNTSNTTAEEERHDRVLFESLVDNEKSYLRSLLRSKLFGEENDNSNTCMRFFTWLINQFKTIEKKTPTPTLLYDLEHLENTMDVPEIFHKEGEPGKENEYFGNLRNGKNINFEETEVDELALAQACKKYIRSDVELFDDSSIEKMKMLYSQDASQEERTFFIERLPFIMRNRMVFKQVKSVISKQDANKEESKMPLDESIRLWSDVLVSGDFECKTKEAVLKDLLEAEFEYVPLSFYE